MSGLFGMAGAAKARAKSEIARARASAAQSKALEASNANMSLEKRVNKLSLVCMALWSLLSETCGLTEEDLMARVRQIDLMDGVEDGKLEHQKVSQCANCGRTMSTRHQRCLYCGAEKLKLTAFDDLV